MKEVFTFVFLDSTTTILFMKFVVKLQFIKIKLAFLVIVRCVICFDFFHCLISFSILLLFYEAHVSMAL